MSLNSRMLEGIFNLARSRSIDAITLPTQLTHLCTSERERATTVIALIANAIDELSMALACVMRSDVHATAGDSAKLKEIARNSSPELLLYVHLYSHFLCTANAEAPQRAALACLKSLGHEIPEDLIPGLITPLPPEASQ